MILTVAQAREHITTSLGNDGLERLLDAAEEAIIRAAGPAIDDYIRTDVTERCRPSGSLLRLTRRAISIVEIREGTTVLGSGDYELSSTGYVLLRTPDGHHWYRPEVTYAPWTDTASREVAQIGLVRLELNFNPALAGYTTGSDSETFATGIPYKDQRDSILASLVEDADGMIR